MGILVVENPVLFSDPLALTDWRWEGGLLSPWLSAGTQNRGCMAPPGPTHTSHVPGVGRMLVGQPVAPGVTGLSVHYQHARP